MQISDLCPEIRSIIQNELTISNEIIEISTGWTEANAVVYMRNPIAQKAKNNFQAISNLSYWIEKGTPHNPPEEGYFCETHKEGIAFPLPKNAK